MWICDKCQEIVDDDVTVCTRCGQAKDMPAGRIGPVGNQQNTAYGPRNADTPIAHRMSSTPAAGQAYSIAGAQNPWRSPSRIIVLLLGISAVLLSGFVLNSERVFKTKAVRTNGTIVGWKSSENDTPHANALYPVIDYRTRDGQTYRLTGDFGFSGGTFDSGKVVTVYYDPKDPGHAKYYQPAAEVVFWLGLGIGCCVIWGTVASAKR